MGVLTRWFEQRFHPSEDPPSWWSSMSGWSTASGVNVTPETSLQSTAVFACIRVLAETVASLPLHVYRRLPSGGKERAPDHYLYSILHDLPNPEMTSFELREVLMGHLCGWGNAFAEIEIDGAGKARALWPLRPDKMLVRRRNGELQYVYRLPDRVGGREVILPQDLVFHVRGLGFDGLVGYSPVQLARQAVGLTLAAEEFGARFYGNNAVPGVALEHPGNLSDEAEKHLRESWEEMHKGLENAHRIAILEEGMKLNKIGIPPNEAQFLETRKFQVTEICRLYRVPPHMIGDLEKATFSNIEHQAIEFVVHTLRPWLVRWEQAIRRDVLMPSERRTFFTEFLVDGLLRGDAKSRNEAYAIGRQWGWWSANDVREMENQNPIEGGDAYLIPLNMIPADQAGDLRSPSAVSMETRSSDPVEIRSIRAAAMRRRLALAHRGIFIDAAARILRREINDVRNGAKKYFKRRQYGEFSLWLDRFYSEHREFVQRQMLPVFLAYAELVAAEAGEEVAGDGVLTPELEQFVRAYNESHSDRHVSSSAGQVRSVVRTAEESGGDPLEALDQRFSEWEERRPGKIAGWETIRAGNAVARAVYIAAGITRLRWNSQGETCPYCSHLDGKVVGVQGSFLSAGEPFQPEGAEKPLVNTHSVKHPPAHEGCDCMITVGI